MQDLFTVKYSSFPAPVPGWQMGAAPGMSIPVQYNNVVVLLKSKLLSHTSILICGYWLVQ